METHKNINRKDGKPHKHETKILKTHTNTN